jgi:peptidoglycan/LPS O-acetylase OafA/YrhL
LAWGIFASSGFFRARVTEVNGNRFEMLDGLRGFLALGVFFVHVATTYVYYTEGRWDSSSARFQSFVGAAGVSLFFMITGFLFWLRVLRSRASLDAKSLYMSRLRRLVPMYAASVMMVLTIVAVLSGFSLREDVTSLLHELRPWLSFGFMTTGDVNGVKDAYIINAVYWTLAFEWAFYVALPFLALFARGAWCAGLFAGVLFFGTQAPIVLTFLFGALAALAVDRQWLRGQLRPAWLAPVPIAALACIFFFFDTVYALAPAALLFVFFLFVVDGNNLSGILSSTAAKLLGTVSYSLYLNHCIVLFVTMRAVNAVIPIGELAPLQYWSFAAFAALAAVALSAVTYRYIEYPFMVPQRGAERPAVAALGRAHAS